jgi:predicted nuclease of restriction endonuclease-like RecB superfamily
MLKNKRIAAWDYEPETFWFEHIKRGVISYTPDFRVTRLDGTQYYVEVKGWMDRKSKTKLARFRRFYKSETLEVVDAKAYRRLGSSLRGVIKNWEAA